MNTVLICFSSSTKTRLVLHAWSFLRYWMQGLAVGAWGLVVKKPQILCLLWTKCFWLSFLTFPTCSCDRRYFILTFLTGLMSKIYWTIPVIFKCSNMQKCFFLLLWSMNAPFSLLHLILCGICIVMAARCLTQVFCQTPCKHATGDGPSVSGILLCPSHQGWLNTCKGSL